MVRRGLSQGEKRKKLVEVIAKHKMPMNLKEIEKLGMKAGVNSMTIKGVLTELVDDNEIDMDKIGSSNFYWCFPSKKLRLVQQKLSRVERTCDQLDDELLRIRTKISLLKTQRESSEKRTENLRTLNLFSENIKNLCDKVGKCRNEIKTVDMMLAISWLRKQANLWTENMWATRDTLKKNFGATNSVAEQQLGIKGDFDYPSFIVKSKKQVGK